MIVIKKIDILAYFDFKSKKLEKLDVDDVWIVSKYKDNEILFSKNRDDDKSNLFTFDCMEKKETEIANVSLPIRTADMCFNLKSNCLYYDIYDSVYKVNMQNGSSEMVYCFTNYENIDQVTIIWRYLYSN